MTGKLIGALLIALSSASAAIRALQYETGTRRELSLCCALLELVRAEVEALSDTDTLIMAIRRSSGLEGFAERLTGEELFAVRWERACRESFPKVDTRRLRALGAFLGRYDSASELSVIGSTLTEYTLLLEEARRGSQQKRRTSAGITAAVGALLIIVLL